MKNKFSWKVFISMGLTYSFIIILITGIVLYLTPSGRVAHWTNWKLFGFTKGDWEAIHVIFTLLFSILSIFHLFTINWKLFWSYLKIKSIKGINKKKEFYLSTIATILIFLGVIYSVPPFSSIIDYGDYLTESWDTEKTAPPIPHAELLTLNELVKQLEESTIEKITSKLNAKNINFNNAEETLLEIGELNNLSPIEIYNIIAKKSQEESSGSGLGKKTIETFAKENNKGIDEVLHILKTNHIKAKKGQTLREIATENNIGTREVRDLIQ